MKKKTFLLTIILLLCLAGPMQGQDAEIIVFPALYQADANVNLRQRPTTHSLKTGSLQPHDTIKVERIVNKSGADWGMTITPKGDTNYVAMRYLSYAAPYVAPEAAVRPVRSWWQKTVMFNRKLIWIAVALLIVSIVLGWDSMLTFSFIYVAACAVAAVVTWLFHLRGETGATIASMVMVCIALFRLFFFLLSLADVFYRIITLPGLALNRLQWFLMAPWRYFVREGRFSDKTNEFLRKTLPVVLGIPCYILGFAIRPIAAVYYNIIVKIPMEFYHYIMEVFDPKSRNEGAGSFFRWLYMLPYRIGFYVVYHGLLTIIECVGFTLFDTFVPTLTMFHGTSFKVSECITAARDRNKYRLSNSNWLSGIWNVGSAFWGGHGIYFAISRALAYAYSTRADSHAIIISRVSLGKVLPLSLMPRRIYEQTGHNGKAHMITQFALSNHYTTGEWWNYRVNGKAWGERKEDPVWEYCLFDWKNAYNCPWRIRPLYVHNKSNGGIQRIPGGMTHWFFRDNLISM